MATGGSDKDTEADDTVNKLTCAVCLEQYRRPKLLSCFHTFCQSCLQNIAGSSPSLACPSCRSPVLLPPGGVKALQSNFYIEEDLKNAASSPQPQLCDACTEDREATHTCIQCQQRFCLPCRTCHDGIRLCHGHTVVPLTPEDQDGCGKGGASPEKAGDKPQQVCSKHPDQRLVLHCKQCQADICMQCKLTQHDGHPAEDLVDIQAKAKTSLQGKLQEVTQQRQLISHLIVALDDRRDKVAKQQQDTELESQKRADILRQWVNQSADDMLTSIKTTTKELDKPLQDQIEQLKNKDLTLQAQQDHMARVLKDDKNPDIVSLEAQLSASFLPSTDFNQIEKDLTADIPKLGVKHSTSAVSQMQLREFVGVLQPVQPESLPLQPSSAGVSTDSTNTISRKLPQGAIKLPLVLKYSKNPESSVIAMCPISQNRLWVMYSPANDAAPLLKLFDVNGNVLTVVENVQQCSGFVTILSDTIMSWNYQSSCGPVQLIDHHGKLSIVSLGFSIGHLMNNATNDRKYLRKIGQNKLCQANFLKAGDLECIEPNTFCDTAPQTNCPGHVSSKEKFVAFIHEGKVLVYRKGSTAMSSPFSSYKPKKTAPVDLRFCQVDGQERLLVLLENGAVVHVVDHTDGGVVVCYLGTVIFNWSTCQCLASNFDQRLWIGCRGGTVAIVDL